MEENIKPVGSMLPTFGQCDEPAPPPQAPVAAPSDAIRKAVSANMLLMGLFVAGIACLWMLSLRKGPATASAQETVVESTVDTALAELTPTTGKNSKETAAVLDTFYYEAKHRQIPQGRLKANPFVYAMPQKAVAAAPEPQATPAPRAPVAVSAETQEAMAAVKKLSLQSVLMGNHQTVAMISNNLLGEGQTIEGWTVSSIESRTVTLTWKDQKYMLQMSE